MNGEAESLLRLAGGLALLCVYGLAFREWLSGEVARDLTLGQARHARRWARGLCAAALALLLAALALEVMLLGRAQALTYWLGNGGWLWAEAFMILVLAPAGAARAAALGRRPLGGWRRGGAAGAHSRSVAPNVSALALTLAGMLLWTFALARLVPHQALAVLPRRLMGAPQAAGPLSAALAFTLLTLAPVLEEPVFRLYLLHRIAWAWRGRRAGPAVAIVFSAALFALAHGGMLQPYWLKLAQAFGVGLALGVAAWRRGLAASLILHWLFNLSLAPFGEWLK